MNISFNIFLKYIYILFIVIAAGAMMGVIEVVGVVEAVKVEGFLMIGGTGGIHFATFGFPRVA
jgi:hypothetical protein